MNKKLFLFNLFIILFMATPAFCLTTFNPRLSITEEITDNLNLSNDNELEEFILIPAADLQLAITNPTYGADITYSPSYSIYQNYTDNNAFRQSANLNLWKDITRSTRFDLSDTLLRTEDPLGDPEDTTIRRDRQLYYRNTARASLTHRFGREDAVNVAYEYSTLENESPAVEDNKRHRPSASLTYWLNRQWGTEAEFIFDKGEFETSEDLKTTIARFRLTHLVSRHFQAFGEYRHVMVNYEEDIEEDYKIYAPTIGVAWFIDDDTNISISGGYYFRDFETSDTDEGPVVDTDINKTWRFRRSSVTFTGSSGYDLSYFGSENLGFYWYYSVGASATYGFTRHLTGQIQGAYRYTKYLDTEPDERKDELPTAGCSLNYQITEWLNSSLGYTFRKIVSNYEENEYTENRFMLMMRISPVQPYRL